eukprot:scaffold14619_cov146-Amphora_coffeaeformis.AAC.3
MAWWEEEESFHQQTKVPPSDDDTKRSNTITYIWCSKKRMARQEKNKTIRLTITKFLFQISRDPFTACPHGCFSFVVSLVDPWFGNGNVRLDRGAITKVSTRNINLNLIHTS